MYIFEGHQFIDLMANTFFSFDILAFVFVFFWGFEIEKVKFVSIYLKSLRKIVHSFFSSSVFFLKKKHPFLVQGISLLKPPPISNKVCNNFLSKGFMKWPFFLLLSRLADTPNKLLGMIFDYFCSWVFSKPTKNQWVQQFIRYLHKYLFKFIIRNMHKNCLATGKKTRIYESTKYLD